MQHDMKCRMYLGLGMPSHTPFFCKGHQGRALLEGLQRGPSGSCWVSSAAAAERVGGRGVWVALGDLPWGVAGGVDPLCLCLAACLHFEKLMLNYVSTELMDREWQREWQNLAAAAKGLVCRLAHKRLSDG